LKVDKFIKEIAEVMSRYGMYLWAEEGCEIVNISQHFDMDEYKTALRASLYE
jgi:hypothetical protein